MFPPGKSGQEVWGFEISRLKESLCRDSGKFFYISKDFSGTDNYHSDIKNASVLRYCKLKFFLLTKNYFSNLQKFYDKILKKSKPFLQFVEKMEKLKRGLSKQHHKMLKIKSEMLKIRKNVKIIKLEKIFRIYFPRISEKCFENFPFPGLLKIREKGKP